MRQCLVCVTVLLLGACSSDPNSPNEADDSASAGQPAKLCIPGALVACDCMGKQGISACDASGATYGACQCPSGSAATAPPKTNVGGTGGTAPVAMTGGPSAGAGASTAPPALDAGAQPDDNGPVQTKPDEPTHAPLVSGLKVAEIAIYQPVKVTLIKAGEAVVARNAPVVVGKQALVRVSV